MSAGIIDRIRAVRATFASGESLIGGVERDVVLAGVEADVAELVLAAIAISDECSCSDMQRAHGHHFGCSTKALRVALANCGDAE